MTTTQSAPLRPSTPSRRGGNHIRRRKIIRWAKRLVLGVLGLAVVASIVYAWVPKPVIVDVAVAKRQPLQVEIAEDGQTRVRDRFVVSAPTHGELTRIELEAGATVTAGQELALITPPPPVLLDARTRKEASARLALANARLRRATVAIERATTSRDLAIHDAERSRILAERGAITAAERERADAAEQLAIQDLAGAELERTAAAAEVAAARAALDDRTEPGARATAMVRAPASGRILRVLRDSAGPIASGTPLVEIGDPRLLEVVIDVLSSDAARITPGMPVWIERWGGDEALRASVASIEPSAFTRISALGVEEQRVRVIARLDDPPATLGDGFRVSARIITWSGDRVLSIPASALFRDRGQWSVYVIIDGRARLRGVTVGHRGRLDVEIIKGLTDGDRVIAHPSDTVHDGARVEPRSD